MTFDGANSSVDQGGGRDVNVSVRHVKESSA